LYSYSEYEFGSIVDQWLVYYQNTIYPSFNIVDNLFIHLHNAIIKTNKLHMLKRGIEQNVQETDEIYGHFTTQVGNVKLHSGFCALQCNFDLDDYTMHELLQMNK
jgi:hypothetical protein